MFRVEVDPSEPFFKAVEKLESQLPAHGALRVSSQPNTAATGPDANWSRTVGELGLKHGEIIFFEYDPPQDGEKTAQAEAGSSDRVVEDPVDQLLEKETGRIPRKRSKLCRHGEKGMCEYCRPLDPYDEEYRVDHGIKHLSFHANIRRLQSENSRPKVLEEPFYSIKPNCPNHAPWPAGICSACQPSPISLQLQRFRVVDHVEFADSAVMNNFIDWWRQTNTQRIGFLVGNYAPYDQVPLGISAVVHAIWEPEQQDALDGVLLQQLESPEVEKALNALGMRILGVIFTDLIDSGKGDGTVVCKRNSNSYFLSSLEVIFSAKLQQKFKNPSKYAEGGYFSSKFVTCVVSGNATNQIDLACYQVSAAAEGLVQADLIEASTNPSVMRVKPRSSTRYVPDVSYKEMNEYNRAVQKDAKPAFPVDYLVVSLSNGFSTSGPILSSTFPIENRALLRSQTPSQLSSQLELEEGFNSDNMADFHLLVYLFSLHVLQPEEEKKIGELLKLELGGNADQNTLIDIATQIAYSSGFSTLRMLAQHS